MQETRELSSALIALAVALVVVGAVLTHRAVAVLHAIIGEVNSQLPDEKQISGWGFSQLPLAFLSLPN